MKEGPNDQPRPPDSFVRFENLVKRVLKVSKTELDARLAAQRASKARQKTADS